MPNVGTDRESSLGSVNVEFSAEDVPDVKQNISLTLTSDVY